MGREGYLGELEQMVLWVVLRHDGKAYGTPILNELESRVGRTVTPGALYATLDRLQDKGMLESSLADPEPGRGGRRKRYLTVTTHGRSALAKTRAAWTQLWDGIEAVER